MHRTWIAATAALALFAGMACGDGDDKETDATAATGSPSPAITSEPTLPVAPTRVPPTAVPNTGRALTVVAGQKSYTPTVDEFRALPTVEIDAGGAKKKGVTLQALLEKVGAGSVQFVTIEGLRANLGAEATTRYAVSGVAANTILVLDEAGHLEMFSGSIPQAEWLKGVSALSFQ